MNDKDERIQKYEEYFKNIDYAKTLEKQCIIHRSAVGKIVIEINVTIPIDVVELVAKCAEAEHVDIPDFATRRIGILYIDNELQKLAEDWAKEYRRMKYSQLDYGFEKVFSRRENRYGTDYFYECVVIL